MEEKKIKKRDHLIKKGQVLNPLGGGAQNPIKRETKRLTHEEVKRVMDLILEKDLDGLKEVMKNPNSTVLEVWIASIAIKSINKGDSYALNLLLERAVGKVKDKIELSGPDGGPAVMVVLPFNDRPMIGLGEDGPKEINNEPPKD